MRCRGCSIYFFFLNKNTTREKKCKKKKIDFGTVRCDNYSERVNSVYGNVRCRILHNERGERTIVYSFAGDVLVVSRKGQFSECPFDDALHRYGGRVESRRVKKKPFIVRLFLTLMYTLTGGKKIRARIHELYEKKKVDAREFINEVSPSR